MKIIYLAIVACIFLFPGCGKKSTELSVELSVEDDRIGEGRIPSCLADSGIDLFAVESDSVIGLSWNNNSMLSATGGYTISYGTTPEQLYVQDTIPCIENSCEHTLRGLENHVLHYFQVDALDTNGKVLITSCSISATPHPLAFLDDVRVFNQTNPQGSPCITGGIFGVPLYVAWEASSRIYLSRSDDLGDTWNPPRELGGAGNNAGMPRIALLDRSPDTLVSFLFTAFSSGGNVQVIRGTFGAGLSAPVGFETPITIGPGENPSIAAVNGLVLITYENNSTILVSHSIDDGLTFTKPVRIDKAGASEESHAPSAAINPHTLQSFISYHGRRGAGDDNVYLVRTLDTGKTYSQTETRIDNDVKGQNQRFVSIAVDSRTAVLSATWEDRRGGANIYYAQSLDSGITFTANVQTGAGLSGDQFTPKAVVDAGRNVYVLFIDNSDGQKPMFSRLNSDGGFDPALPVSTQAGTAGTAAKEPWVFVDNYGTVFTVWAENRGGPVDYIFFARAE